MSLTHVTGRQYKIQVQPGPAGIDVVLMEADPSNPHPTNPHAELWSRTGQGQRYLVQFPEVADVPGGSTIDSASLTLKEIGRSNADLKLYPVTKFWLKEQATWNEAIQGDSWTNPGGDYNSAIEVAFTLLRNRQSPIPIQPIVTEWVNSGINYGLIGMNTNTYGPRIATNDYATNSERPKLEVVFTTDPAGAAVTASRLIDGLADSEFDDPDRAQERKDWFRHRLNIVSKHLAGNRQASAQAMVEHILKPRVDGSASVPDYITGPSRQTIFNAVDSII